MPTDARKLSELAAAAALAPGDRVLLLRPTAAKPEDRVVTAPTELLRTDAYTKAESDGQLALKADLVSGLVPASQLPSYVDDVLEVSTFTALPAPGETGKIYVVLDTNKQFRWSGSQYIEIGKAPVLYSATGQNTDGAMTQKAITDALGTKGDLTTVNLHTAQITDLQAKKADAAVVLQNGAVTTYTSSQTAVNAAPSGSVVLLRGAQAALTVGGTVTIDATGSNWGTNVLTLLPYPIATGLVDIILRGGSANGRVVVVRQNATCSLRLEDCTFGTSAWLELFALGGDSTYFTSITLVRCRQAKAFGTGATAGNIFFQSRNDYGQRFQLTLLDCDFSNTVSSVFTGSIHPDSRIYLQGSTRLSPAASQPLATLVNASDSSPANLATILVDQRTPAAPVYTAGAGIDITNYVISNTGGGGGGTGGVTATQLEAVRSTVTVVNRSTGGDLVAAEAGCLVVLSNSQTLTLPTGVFAIGTVIELVAGDAFVVAVAPASGVTIVQAQRQTDGLAGSSLRLVQAAADLWLLTGGV